LIREKPEPKKTELLNWNRPENSRLDRGKPETQKPGDFQPKPPGNFPAEPEHGVPGLQ